MNNICHFVFGMKKQSEEFLFSYYIAVYSAYLINKPENKAAAIDGTNTFKNCSIFKYLKNISFNLINSQESFLIV